MRFVSAHIDGVVVIEPEPRIDARGAFVRTFCADEFAEAGLPTVFPQCNLSRNDRAGTLRGMHFNAGPYAESKVVRCTRGAIYDVVVDLRPGSPTRLRHVAVELTADNMLSLFVPAGFAHGFVTLVDHSDVYYLMGRTYAPHAARGIRWDDPALDISWPIAPKVLSETDAAYPDIDPVTFEPESA